MASVIAHNVVFQTIWDSNNAEHGPSQFKDSRGGHIALAKGKVGHLEDEHR
jgi:hypothetical protein